MSTARCKSMLKIPDWLLAFLIRFERVTVMSDAQKAIIVPDPVMVTYPTSFVKGLTWRERIERCGFNCVESAVWAHIDSFFEVENEDTAPQSIKLDCFGKNMRSDGVESSLLKMGREMISPAMFLHLCEQYLDLYAIACTRAVCVPDNDSFVLSVGENSGGRCLYLVDRDSCWVSDCCFPSTPKIA